MTATDDSASESTTSVETSSTPTDPPLPAPDEVPSTDAEIEQATSTSVVQELAAAPSDGCRRLTDFDDPAFDEATWVIVNDGVMGGRSSGFVEFADSVMRFSGEVVTAGGGFTSVRLRTIGDELIGTDRLLLRVRADDRAYNVTFNDAPGTRQRIAHGAEIVIDGPPDDDGWSIAEVRYDDLRATVFGQPVDAPAFDPEQVSEVGIIISDGIDGPFALEVDWIDGC